MSNATRNYSIDVLRILACVAVILAHIVGVPIMRGQALPGTFDFNLCLFLIGIRRWGVSVFMMITGFFMLDPKKELPLKRLYSKNVLRMLTALIFWSAVYALVLHKPFYPLGSQESHFWYLGMIIGVYLAVPILRNITANPALMKYFLCAWFCIMLYSFIGKQVTLPFCLDEVLFALPPGYCILGYYMRYLSERLKEGDPRIRRVCHGIYWLGLLGLFVTAIGGVISQNDDSILFDYSSPNMIFCSAAILLFAACHHIKPSDRMSAIILNCSECTFGIYLMHALILIEVYNRLARFVPQMIPHMILCTLIAFFLGYAITLIIKKIPFVNKYIV